MKKHFSKIGRVGFVHSEVEDYAAAMSASESEIRGNLALETLKKFPKEAAMMIGPLEAALLQTLLLIANATNVLEIGTFTGYSALAMREVLPANGKIWTFEVCAKHAEVAEDYFKWANAADGAQITLQQVDAHSIPWPADAGTEYPLFDVAFIDAEKEGYIDYWEKCKSHVGTGGIIIADNTLSHLRKKGSDSAGKAIREFNEYVATDGTVHSVLTPIRDGMTIGYVK